MIQKMSFGNLEITGKMLNSSMRIDTYTRNDGSAIIKETCHVTGKNDLSPRVDGDPESENYRRYDSKCSCCFLGFSHSVNAHDSEIGRK